MRNRYLLLTLLLVTGFFRGQAQKNITFTPAQLKDKIKGGWAGQTIGVTYGAPVEFRFQGTMINDYQRLPWYDGLLKKSMVEGPGIYDDLYMDITFVEVFDREGLDAPVASHAKAFAQAGYMLWHANQAARYNILHGIPAPASGHWTNNPHADCIDYQIESDFAGLMSPAMPNTASEISDQVGHIMNHGDGWYGGVYVGAMYALAFTSSDIRAIVSQALKTIPANTDYYRCIADVIRWHQQYPDDWKQTWFEIQKKWTDDIGCPDGVFAPFNIDAKVNSAYVVLGLLYGNGDFGKSIEIATRAGQDADCNPSTVAGVLGTLLGYDRIPAYWKMGLKEIEDMNFKYTQTSLNRVYELSYQQALANIKRKGGSVGKDKIILVLQEPKPVREEKSFPRLVPQEKNWIGKDLEKEGEYRFDFTGTAFVIGGELKPKTGTVYDEGLDKVARVELYIDDQLEETILLPMAFQNRRAEIAWKYQLENKKHSVRLRLLNPDTQSECLLTSLLTYSEK
jgi:hypothetical protein